MDVFVNRAPFLTLWASIVARRLGYDADEALTLGRAVAGLTAAAKARRLGLAERNSVEDRADVKAEREGGGAEDVPFMGRRIPCVRTPAGLRALAAAAPADPAGVRRYVESKFKDALPLVEEKLEALAGVYAPKELEDSAMDLYLRMRPITAGGRAGWGQVGRLDLDVIDRLRADRV